MISREEMECVNLRLGRTPRRLSVVCLSSEPVFWPSFDFAAEAL